MLVDLNIKNLKPKTHTYFVADEGICPGLVVRVTPNGNKAFVLRMKKNGKRKTKTIGTYGEVSLSDARKEGLKLRGQISLGEDVFSPEPTNDHAPEPQRQATVKDLSDTYIKRLEERDARNLVNIRQFLKKDILPPIGKLVANEVTPYDIGSVLRPVIERGSVGQAKKIRSYLHSMFNVGMALEYDPMADASIKFGITSNPVTPVPVPIKGVTTCDRFLSEAEVKRVWSELPNHCNFNGYMVWRLLICTGCRVEEIMNAKWSQIEDDILFLPKTKNGKPCEVALNEIALGLIEKVREVNGHADVLFPQANTTTIPMLTHSLGHAVRKMIKRTGIVSFAPRDARRTVKTLALKNGIKKDIMDKVQNHAQHDVSSKHYIRYDFIKEKREAMVLWNEILCEILS